MEAIEFCSAIHSRNCQLELLLHGGKSNGEWKHMCIYMFFIKGCLEKKQLNNDIFNAIFIKTKKSIFNFEFNGLHMRNFMFS